MKFDHCRILFLALLIGLESRTAAAGDAATSTNRVADARGKWFRDAKVGAFNHFGLYSELGGYYHGKGPYDHGGDKAGITECSTVSRQSNA